MSGEMASDAWESLPELHPLDGPRGKVVRGVQQALHLCRHCDAFALSNPVQLIVRPDAEGNGQIVFLEGRPPPMYLGLILGEVIHDLRSGLDQLAWQLALDESGPETLAARAVARRILFPITSSREAFASHPAVKYFSSEAVDHIETLQPYHNVGSPLVNPLGVVQDYSNADKHRVLTPSRGQLKVDDLKIRSSEPFEVGEVQWLAPGNTVVGRGTPLLRVPVSAAARIEVHPPPMLVCFHTEITGQPDIVFPDRIHRLAVQIGEAVDSFRRFFPALDWSTRTESWVTPELDVVPPATEV